MIVLDDIADDVIETIKSKAHTGRIGDGKIFISTVEEIIRIRTGEKGKEAIQNYLFKGGHNECSKSIENDKR